MYVESGAYEPAVEGRSGDTGNIQKSTQADFRGVFVPEKTLVQFREVLIRTDLVCKRRFVHGGRRDEADLGTKEPALQDAVPQVGHSCTQSR